MALVEEIPCRDTDPLRDEEEIDSNRDSPVAFTINFGFGEDGESAKEKAKKLERFALRSSLRKPKSPRSPSNASADKTAEILHQKSAIEIMRKSTKPTAGKMTSGLVREKSNVTSYQRTSTTQRTSTATSKLTTLTSNKSVIKPPSKSNSSPKRPAAVPAEYMNGRADSASYNRRLTTTLSPEESKMISHFEKEINEMRSLEIVEASYENDSFEEEEEEEEVDGGEAEGSAPSETGTYTVEEEKEKSKHKADKARIELECLVGAEENRSNYVEDWAARHAPRGPGSGSRSGPGSGSRSGSSPRSGGGGSPREANLSPLGTKSSLSKSRRRLPATPGAVPTPASPENLNFSPVSEDSPSPNQESDEGESSFMKHTQHLVDVMEARIHQKSAGSQKPSRTLISKTSSTVKKTTAARTLSNLESDKEKEKEAWQRRKNYDPLAASGRKKDVVRKNSSSSLVGSRSPNTPPNRTEVGSAKSGSSDSSGYFSRSDGGRFSMRGGPNKGVGRLPTMKPQSKLINSQSASEIKNSSRSSSSLTSKEAEFQAWKRRKNYDPLKSAAAATSNRKTSSPKSAYSPSPTPPFIQPQHKRIQAMTQSMVHDSSDDNGCVPMQRSASFHYENAARALAQQELIATKLCNIV